MNSDFYLLCIMNIVPLHSPLPLLPLLHSPIIYIPSAVIIAGEAWNDDDDDDDDVDDDDADTTP